MGTPAFINDTGLGTPVVFIHAFPLNSDLWLLQHEHLQDKLRIISYDQPGFGKGGNAEPGATMDDYAAQVIDLLDFLHIEKCIIGGCSMGGYIAMAALKHYKERFTGAIFTNTRAAADGAEAKQKRYDQIEQIKSEGMDFLIEGMTLKLVGSMTKMEKLEIVQQVRNMMHAATPEGTIAALGAMAERPDSTEFLGTLDIPALVIHGEEDEIIPAAEAKAMAESIPDAAFHIVPEAGHLACIEQHVPFNQYVREFVKNIR